MAVTDQCLEVLHPLGLDGPVSTLQVQGAEVALQREAETVELEGNLAVAHDLGAGAA